MESKLQMQLEDSAKRPLNQTREHYMINIPQGFPEWILLWKKHYKKGAKKVG